MAERRQLPPGFFRNEGLDLDIASLKASLRETAAFERFLNVETEIGNIRDELSVSLRLIKSAHDSETDLHAVLFHECRNDCVQRSFARLQRVRMILFEREEAAAVVRDESGAGSG